MQAGNFVEEADTQKRNQMHVILGDPWRSDSWHTFGGFDFPDGLEGSIALSCKAHFEQWKINKL